MQVIVEFFVLIQSLGVTLCVSGHMQLFLQKVQIDSNIIVNELRSKGLFMLNINFIENGENLLNEIAETVLINCKHYM